LGRGAFPLRPVDERLFMTARCEPKSEIARLGGSQ
jgi:hypothetical protein